MHRIDCQENLNEMFCLAFARSASINISYLAADEVSQDRSVLVQHDLETPVATSSQFPDPASGFVAESPGASALLELAGVVDGVRLRRIGQAVLSEFQGLRDGPVIGELPCGR